MPNIKNYLHTYNSYTVYTHNKHLYIYTYIYVCVCACICTEKTINMNPSMLWGADVSSPGSDPIRAKRKTTLWNPYQTLLKITAGPWGSGFRLCSGFPNLHVGFQKAWTSPAGLWINPTRTESPTNSDSVKPKRMALYPKPCLRKISRRLTSGLAVGMLVIELALTLTHSVSEGSLPA